MSMSTLAIETRDLVRTYRTRKSAQNPSGGTVVAVDGITLQIPRGELFGLLGPNGAGKTTAIKVLVTLLLPTSGSARVAGFDVARETQQIRERISMVSGGESSGYGLLTVREQLWMFSQFYGLPSRAALGRIDELWKVVGLFEERHRRVSALSSGMRQKMNLVRGLLPDPEILFLDEPTLGLDVGAARDVRAYIREWVRQRPGRTILLTTHYMHEAEELCDRVAIIHKGAVVVDRKSTRLNSSHVRISYAVFCLKKKTNIKFCVVDFFTASTKYLQYIIGERNCSLFKAETHPAALSQYVTGLPVEHSLKYCAAKS